MRFNGGQTIYRGIYWKSMKGRDGDLCFLRITKELIFFLCFLMSTETGVSEVTKVFLGEIFQSLNY